MRTPYTRTACSSHLPTPNTILGYGSNAGVRIGFNGYIANIQIYNATLSTSEIQSLYTEGIGGVPVRLDSLIAWWPLNGNPNDYSGNGNNGVPTSVTYSGGWTEGCALR